METRIAPVEPPYSDEVQQALSRMMPPGAAVEPLLVFRTLATRIKLGRRVAAVGGALFGGALPLADRELVILRTTARCGAEYEWGVHVTWLSAAAGLSPAQVEATRAPAIDDALWSPRQLALLRAADMLHERADLDDATWEAVAEHLDGDQRTELLVLAGFYRLISCLVNGARLPPEPWAARWDGADVASSRE